MRPAKSVLSLSTLALAGLLPGCDGCRSEPTISAKQRTELLASAIKASAAPAPSVNRPGIGHPANVIPGQGPKRIELAGPRSGPNLVILPGQGIGPIRFGATKETIERLMGAPCDDATETLCRYVGRAVDFKLEGGAVTEIRISRKGREAKRTPDGSIVEYGFFNGVLLPDLYFGMLPSAIQEHLGQPSKIEPISPLGADSFAERHVYDGITLEYDRWSNGNLVLGAAVLTKSATAAAANEKRLAAVEKRAAEAAERGKRVKPTLVPR